MGDFYDSRFENSGKVLFLLNPETGKHKDQHMPLVQKYGFIEIEPTQSLHKNFTKNEIERTLEEAAAGDYSKCACFLCVIWTHGDLETETRRRLIFDYDNDMLYLDQILNLFNGVHLEGKPKIFMVTGCAGDELQVGASKSKASESSNPKITQGVELQANASGRPTLTEELKLGEMKKGEKNYKVNCSFPDDCCVIYTSPKGYSTSWSISIEVVEALEEYEGKDAQSLLEILTIAMKNMTARALEQSSSILPDEDKQVPSAFLEHSLTADLLLKITAGKTSSGEVPYKSSGEKKKQETYEWTSTPEHKGSCRIEIFYFRYSENGLPERDGDQKDVEELKLLETYFKGMGVDVNNGKPRGYHIHRNRKKDEVKAILEKISKGENNNNYDCYFFFFLCFGRGEKMFCHDGQDMFTEDLLIPFKGNTDMLGKPKVFCFQACDLDLHNAGEGYKGSEGEEEVTPVIPIEADFLTIHSTVPAKFKASCTSDTEERPSDASFLIQSFVKAFEDTKERRMDLLRLTTRMNRKVQKFIAGSTDPVVKQCHVPRVTSTLTKLMHFPPKC